MWWTSIGEVSRCRSEGHPTAEPNADGSTTVYFAPTQPPGVARGNWIQTMPGKGWFTILRLYSPLEPLFDKSWRSQPQGCGCLSCQASYRCCGERPSSGGR